MKVRQLVSLRKRRRTEPELQQEVTNTSKKKDGQRHLSFKSLASLAAAFTLLSFAWSFVGLYSRGRPLGFDYTPPTFLTEVGGHFAFGAIAALSFLDFDLIILTGALAVLIDVDHILSVAGFNSVPAVAHSLLFGTISSLALFVMSRKGGIARDRQYKILALGGVVLFSHISYDAFAGWYAFPLYVPLSFGAAIVPSSSWIVFEAVAILLAALGYLLSKRYPAVRVPDRRMHAPKSIPHPSST